jgi:hypothetical protein
LRIEEQTEDKYNGYDIALKYQGESAKTKTNKWLPRLRPYSFQWLGLPTRSARG